MSQHKFKTGLSVSGINKVITELTAYRDDLERRSREIVKRLTDEGTVILRAEVVRLSIPDTGYLLSRCAGIYDAGANIGTVFCECDYAVFVEFGTGVKGQSSAYPGEAMARAAYHYMGGTTYVILADGRIGWYYPADDGTWKFTEGMPSRPFMYNTAKQIRDMAVSAAREVFL
ncbi:MAG: HK97 gp10 family phage protein [Ruminococcus sp.]|nr:HK97 gp10 family phage protein [Ruminococcus sp.]